MRGVRQLSRRRSALLVVTVLAAIAAVLMALQIGHTTAAGDVHAPLPALLGTETHPEILTPAAADAADLGTEDTDPPAGGLHLQLSLTALAGALAVLVSALARRRTPHGEGGSRPMPTSIRARAPSPTPAVSPMPVLSSTCVLRV